MEDDLVLEANENDRQAELNIIDNQLIVINTLMDVEGAPYDSWEEDRIKVIVRAMKLIYKTQNKLIKEVDL